MLGLPPPCGPQIPSDSVWEVTRQTIRQMATAAMVSKAQENKGAKARQLAQLATVTTRGEDLQEVAEEVGRRARPDLP